MSRLEVDPLLLNGAPTARLDFHLPAALRERLGMFSEDDFIDLDSCRAHVQTFGDHPFVTIWLLRKDLPYAPLGRPYVDFGRDMEATYTDRALHLARPLPEVRDRLCAAHITATAFDEHGRLLHKQQERNLKTDRLVHAMVLCEDHEAVSAIEGSGRLQLGLIAAHPIRRGDYITLYSRGAFVALSDEPESACPEGFEYALAEPLVGDARLLVLGNPLESLGCFANRAPRPNAFICRLWLRTPCDGFQLHFALRAESDIAKGKEITLSYGSTWHDDHLVRTQLMRCSARRNADKAFNNWTLLRARELKRVHENMANIITALGADSKDLALAFDDLTNSMNAVIEQHSR